MKKTKPMKPVKAWAIVAERNRILMLASGPYVSSSKPHSEWATGSGTRRVVRVLITEVRK